ncbi:hypothetical protein GCM10009738_27530 [Kitasatospora viridis]
MATVILALAAAGCDDQGDPTPSNDATNSPDLLTTALHQVHATDLTRAWIEFGNTGGPTYIDNGSAADALSTDSLAGFGAPALATQSQLPLLTGIDPAAGRPALSVGRPGDAVGFLYGSFDAAGIGANFRKLGYQHKDLGGGETEWLVRDQDRTDQTSPLAQLGITTALNVVRVSPNRIVYGEVSADVDQALAGGPTLADDAAVGPVAGCLVDTVAAQIGQDPKVGRQPLGVGVRAPVPTDATEVICLPTASDAAAQAAAAAWPGRVASARSTVWAEPWSALLTAPQATVVGGPDHLVRLTARPTTTVQVLFQAVQNADLGSLVGGLTTGGS